MADTTLKRHPGRAAVWGFLLGLGVFIYLTFVWPIIALDSWTSVVTKAVIVVLIVMALSVLWGMFGPAKKPKGYAAQSPPTAAAVDAPPPAPEVEAPPPPPDMDEPPPDVDEQPPEMDEPRPATADAAEEGLCPNCQSATRPGAKVCAQCGTRLADTTDASAPSADVGEAIVAETEESPEA